MLASTGRLVLLADLRGTIPSPFGAVDLVGDPRFELAATNPSLVKASDLQSDEGAVSRFLRHSKAGCGPPQYLHVTLMTVR